MPQDNKGDTVIAEDYIIDLSKKETNKDITNDDD